MGDWGIRARGGGWGIGARGEDWGAGCGRRVDIAQRRCDVPPCIPPWIPGSLDRARLAPSTVMLSARSMPRSLGRCLAEKMSGPPHAAST